MRIAPDAAHRAVRAALSAGRLESSGFDPEYVQTGRPDGASDVYALGVCMLQLASGR